MPEPHESDLLDPANQALAQALQLSLQVLKGIMVLLVLLFLSSGIFIVQQDQEAMVISFGKIQGTLANRILKPGLHWTWPYPLSEVIRMPTNEMKLLVEDSDMMQDFWYDTTSKSTAIVETLDPELDGYCLTGDANIIHCQWQVRYIIIDPYLYYSQSTLPEDLLHSIVCSSIVKVSAQCTIPEDAVLGNLIDKIGPAVKEMAQKKLDELQLGIKIQGFALAHLVPPRQVQEVFESVLKAKTEQDKKIAEAQNYYEQITAKAIGEKAELLAKSANYALQVEKEAQSDAADFRNVLNLPKEHAFIFHTRHYQQVIEKLQEKVREIFLFANEAEERELRLQLNRNPDLYRIQAPKED